jgi:hypothetical protein
MSPATAAIFAHDFCSPGEARRVLRIGRNSVYNALKRHEIPSTIIGGVIKIPTSWLKVQAGITDAA